MRLLTGGTLSLLTTQTLLSLLTTQIAAQNASSNLQPCNIVRIRDQDVFTFSETKLRIEAQLEEDNRPCALLVKKPNEEKATILELSETKGKNCGRGKCVIQDYGGNTTIQVKYIAGKWSVKFYFYKSDEGITFRGKYLISDLTFSAFPRQESNDEIDLQVVSDLTCPDEILHGRVNLTKDFHMCCEYHRSKAINISEENFQCCKKCILLDNTPMLKIQINYAESNLKFSVPAKKDEQINPYTISCVIKGGYTLEFPIRFKQSLSKSSPICFIDYRNTSVGLAVGFGILFLVCVVVIYFYSRKT